MALTNAEKVEVRRYCGYNMIGSTPIQQFGWRFSPQYGQMEFLMNNMSFDEETTVRTTYLPQLRLLETDIPAIRQNLDTARAAVWYWNTKEIRDRERLFNDWRRSLCQFLGIVTGPGLSAGNISFAV